MSNPEDEPLGGKPVLPTPSSDAQRRAHPLFSRILAEQRVDRSEEGQGDWQPEPHEEPTRVVRRSAVSVDRRPQMRHPPAPPPEALSAIAADPFSKLPAAFPEPSPYDDEVPTNARRAFPGMHFASGRRYDATLAVIQAMAGPLEQTEALVPAPDFARGYDDTDGEGTQIDAEELDRLGVLARGEEIDDDDADEPLEPTRVTSRPPPFAPMVRPSPSVRRGPEVIDQESLSAMVDTSMLVAHPDGTAAFEIAFDDEVFSNLACTIAVGPAGIVATFRVADANTRRLLEAEAGRLRVRLSERGLKVAEVKVVTE